MSVEHPPERKQTDRQRLLDALNKGEAFTVPDLSSIVGLSQATVVGLLDSLRNSSIKLDVIPPYCMSCGFRFEARTRSKRPGKCPKCRSGRIARARFQLSS